MIGEQAGDNKALADAARAFRAVLTQFTRDRVSLDWATTQHNLGLALAWLGERESGTAHLTERSRRDKIWRGSKLASRPHAMP